MENVKSLSGSVPKEAWQNVYALLAVLQIRDVNPGSEFFHPESRIQGQKDSGSQIRIRIKVCKYFQPQKLFLTLGNMIRDVHPGSRGQKGTESRIRIRNTAFWSSIFQKKENDFKEGLSHRAPTPSPLPLRVAKTGRNHLNEEITPLLSTGIGERFSQNIWNLGLAALLIRCELPL